MKSILLSLGVVFMVGCSQPTSSKIDLEWTPESGALPASLEKIQTENKSTLRAGDQQIEFLHQTLGGIEVSDSYVKKTKTSDGALKKVQAHFETASVSKLSLMRWQMARKNKSATLQKLLHAEASLKDKKIESFDLNISTHGQDVAPVWILEYSDKSGEIWQAKYSYNLGPLSLEKVGSELDITPAWVYPQGPKKSSLQEVEIANLLKGKDLVSALLKVSSATELHIDVEGEPLQFNLTDSRFDQVQTFYVAQKTLNWFADNFQIFPSQSLDIQVHMGAPDKTNTAFYYSGKIRLGVGDDVIFSKIPWDPSIVAHETSHFIIDLTAHLPAQGEGGSLNEAYADFFAAAMLNNPKIAEASYLKEPFRRRIDTPKKYSEKNGGLYSDSQIVSSLLWEIYRTYGSKNGLALAYQVLQNLTPQSNLQSFKEELLKKSTVILSPIELRSFNAMLKEREWISE